VGGKLQKRQAGRAASMRVGGEACM
jgi:hypothetical protein